MKLTDTQLMNDFPNMLTARARRLGFELMVTESEWWLRSVNPPQNTHRFQSLSDLTDFVDGYESGTFVPTTTTPNIDYDGTAATPWPVSATMWPGGAIGPAGKKHDAGKNRPDLIPEVALTQEGAVLAYGLEKYDEDNWKRHELKDGIRRHYAALLRHLLAYRQGEDYDPESGLHHMAHARTNTGFIIWAENELKKMPLTWNAPPVKP